MGRIPDLRHQGGWSAILCEPLSPNRTYDVRSRQAVKKLSIRPIIWLQRTYRIVLLHGKRQRIGQVQNPGRVQAKKSVMIRKQNEKEVPPASLFFAKIVKKWPKSVIRKIHSKKMIHTDSVMEFWGGSSCSSVAGIFFGNLVSAPCIRGWTYVRIIIAYYTSICPVYTGMNPWFLHFTHCRMRSAPCIRGWTIPGWFCSRYWRIRSVRTGMSLLLLHSSHHNANPPRIHGDKSIPYCLRDHRQGSALHTQG